MSGYVEAPTRRQGLIRAAMAASIVIAALFAVFAGSAKADLAHPFLPGASLDGANTPAEEFNTPCGDAVDSHGDLYVSNFGGGVISVFGPAGNFITQIQDTNGPCGLAVDSVGTVYVYEFEQGQRTVKFNPSSFPPTSTTTYAGAVPLAESSGTYGVAVNPANDHVFVGQASSGRVIEYQSAAEGSGIVTEAFGQATFLNASLGGFEAIGVDGATGDVYVAARHEGSNWVVAVLDSSGTTILHQIDGSSSPSGSFELGLEGLAVDQLNGNFLVTDVNEHGVVQEYTSAGAFVDEIGPTFGGSETFSYAEPSDVAVAPPSTPNAGNVYVTSGPGAEGKVFAFGPLQEPKLTLTVSKSGGGTGTVTSDVGGLDCGLVCSTEIEEGEEVTLTATAATGSEFKGWSGACTGAATCTVSMTEAKAVNAEFISKAATMLTLGVTKSGTGSGAVTSSPTGINCGSACSAQFAKGTLVTLTATAAAGSEFKGWSGACSGAGACVVTMSAVQSVGAQFDTAPSNGGGGSGGGGGGPAPQTCSSDPALCPAGSASVATKAPVKGGKAEIKVACAGPGTCSGSLKLTAKLTTGKGKQKKTKQVVVGKASFNLAAGASTTLKVPLNGAAKQILASGKQLRATVTGSGLKSGSVTLGAAGAKPKKG